MKNNRCDARKSARRLEFSAVLAEISTSTAENRRKHGVIDRFCQAAAGFGETGF